MNKKSVNVQLTKDKTSWAELGQAQARLGLQAS